MQDSETDFFSGVRCLIYDSLVMTSSRTRFPSVREFTELHTMKSVLTYVLIYFVIAIRTLDNLRLLIFPRPRRLRPRDPWAMQLKLQQTG